MTFCVAQLKTEFRWCKDGFSGSRWGARHVETSGVGSANLLDWRPQIRKIETGDRGLLQYANALLKQQRFEDATSAAESFVADHPNSGPGLTTLGLCYLSQKRFRAAVEALKKATVAEPLLPQPAMALGFAHFQARDFDAAEQAFREALNLDPDLLGANIGLSQVLQKTGDLKGARMLLESVVARNPTFRPARLLLAFLHRQAGKPEDATAEVETIMQPTPGLAGVVSLFPMLFRYQSEETTLDEATRLLEAAARFKPKSSAIRTWLGQVRLQSNNFVAAEEEFRRALALNVAASPARFGLVTSLLRQERLDEAYLTLRTITRPGKYAPLLQAAYGDFHYQRGDFAEAVRHYCSALLQTPKGAEVLAVLNKDLSEAEPEAERAGKFQAAAQRLLQKQQNRLKEEEWTVLARRVAHAGWKASKLKTSPRGAGFVAGL